MRLLFVGDVVASCGRNMFFKSIDKIKKQYEIDVIILNGENAVHGRGLSLNVSQELFQSGVNVITTGNHVWNNRDILQAMECSPYILRPANMPKNNPGHGSVIFDTGKVKIGVINLIGRVYMEACDCPFEIVDREIARLHKQTNIIFVDFHAEATSEKVALGWYLDGRVSAVCGTHTHIQTADERILPKGTAYITDVGMTGAYYSVLGMERSVILKRFRTHMPQKFTLAEGAAQLCAVVIDIDEQTGRANHIERIFLLDF